MRIGEIEVFEDIAFFDIVKDEKLIQLYNYAVDQNIILLFYARKLNEKKTRKIKWISFFKLKVILIPIDSQKREVIPRNIWLQKALLAHEIAHHALRGIGEKCKTCPLILKSLEEKRDASCLYQEMVVWIRGWEILRFLGLVLISEEKEYKTEASNILKRQCKNCVKILNEGSGKCLYEIQIRNLLKAHNFELDI